MRSRLQILETPLIERIVDEAMTILEETGIEVEGRASLDRLARAGLPADQKSHRITFPRALVERALETAPSNVRLFDREGNLHAELAGDAVHFVPGSSALHVLDLDNREARPASSRDFVDYVKVADRLPNLSYLSTAFVPSDVPLDVADAWRLYLVLAHSRQPIVTGAFSAHGVPRMAEILSFFRRDRAELLTEPLAIFTCCPNTPLRWGTDALGNLIDCAEWGIPVEVVPVLLLGMISPSTAVGALVLHTAEVLSGLTIAQAVRPGSPVVFGGAPAAFHMQLMTNPMTAVEALQVSCGYAQVAKHLDLPCQAFMGLSDAKLNDPQAGAETAVGMFLAALSGINSVSGAGMLDYCNCFSLEKLVFDDEIAGHARRFARPIEVKEDLPTRPLIAELLRDKHLLTSEHTLRHWREELFLPGPLIDRTSWDQWEAGGRKLLRDRALQVIQEALRDHREEPLEDRLHREIRSLLLEGCEARGAVLPELGG